jgi:hypothetical protein
MHSMVTGIVLEVDVFLVGEDGGSSEEPLGSA